MVGMRRLRSRWPLLVVPLLLALGSCSSGDNEADPLDSYTDAGDGCGQVVTAISYADAVLKPLGQEPYQDFTDAVRSRVAAVDGTTALEVKDFPSKTILKQAQRTGRLATRASKLHSSMRARVLNLRKYRREAAELVLICAPYVDPTPSPSASGN
jgi:hypothetical protein